MLANSKWAEHPGIILKEEMETRGWSQRDLALVVGCAEQTINRIVNGKAGISADMSKALAVAFSVSAEFFNNLQKIQTQNGDQK